MQITQQSISPKRATELLGTIKLNRNIRARHVAELARQIANGEWDANNPAPIGISTQGKLLDGQHRLLALVEANKTCRMWVAEGLPPGTMANIDTGSRRTMGDVLKLRGEVNVNVLAGALHQLWGYERYRLMAGRLPNTPSHGELLAMLEKHEDLRETIKDVSVALHRTGMQQGVGPSIWNAFYYIAAGVNGEDASEFLTLVATGEALGTGDPILALRRYIIGEGRLRHPPRRVMAAVIIKSWNAWRRRDHVEVVSFKPGGRAPEKFPEIE
jgi:hypothetical protein